MSEAQRTQHIKEFFDEDSQRYLTARYPSLPTNCDEYSYLVRKRNVLDMLDRIGRRGRILDIGCGPAVYTRDLVERGWNVCGMDLSTGMLQAAAKATNTLAGTPVKFTTGHAEHLPYRDESFDTVLCIGVVSYVTDVPTLLRDVKRILKPGGEAIFQISNSLSVSEIDLKLRRALGRFIPARGELDSHDRFRARVLLHPYRPSTFDDWCAGAGLVQREFQFFDFRQPLIVDRLAPRLSLRFGQMLEGLSRSRAAACMAVGYLARVARKA